MKSNARNSQRKLSVIFKYGTEEIPFALPDQAEILWVNEPETRITASEFASRIRGELERLDPDVTTVAVVVADKTRLCGYPEFLPVLLDTLKDFGALWDKITVYIAYGTHPHQTHEESIAAYGDPREFFIKRVVEGISTIAAAFYPNTVILRMSDFKSNEYANLIGGKLYEPDEENPMIGFRGAGRYVAESFRACFEMECEALKRVRDVHDEAEIEVGRHGLYLLYGGLAGMALWPIAQAVPGHGPRRVGSAGHQVRLRRHARDLVRGRYAETDVRTGR